MLSYNPFKNVPKKYVYPILLSFLIFPLITTIYTNCSKVEISRLNLSSEMSTISMSSQSPTYLPIPVPEDKNYRAIFLVDMSHSMVASACQDSLDRWVENESIGQSPTEANLPSEDCSNPTGLDTKMNRLKIIEKWIVESTEVQNKNKMNDEKLKFLIVPFSGGDTTNNLITGTFSEQMQFLNGEEAISFVRQLAIVQMNYGNSQNVQAQKAKLWFNPDTVQEQKLKRFIQDYGNTSEANGKSIALMGNSVPRTGLVRVKERINSELTNPLNKDKSYYYELAFMTDGVPKPRAVHFAKAAEIYWDGLYILSRNAAPWESGGEQCSRVCSLPYQNKLYSGIESNEFKAKNCRVCESHLSSMYSIADNGEYLNYLQGFGGTLLQSMKITFGDVVENRESMILGPQGIINEIAVVIKSNARTKFRFNFLQIPEKNEKGVTLISGREMKQDINWLKKAEDPFGKSNHRFKEITRDTPPMSFFPQFSSGQRNYNVSSFYIVNLNRTTFGEVDSDGDGVSDILDQNSQMARTNGFCLDSVENKGLQCLVVACDKNSDVDHDGLNECEEKSIGTNVRSLDTDRDRIPDIFEFLRGFNPIVSDFNISTMNDGYSNHQHFKMGIGPQQKVSQFRIQDLIQSNIKFTKYENGRAGYMIDISSLPLVPTTKVNSDLFGKSKAALENKILFLIEVVNVEDSSDSYWLMTDRNISYPGPFQLDLSQLFDGMEKFGEIE